jgi:hypothetical protein
MLRWLLPKPVAAIVTRYIAHRHGDVNSRVQQFVELALALR